MWVVLVGGLVLFFFWALGRAGGEGGGGRRKISGTELRGHTAADRTGREERERAGRSRYSPIIILKFDLEFFNLVYSFPTYFNFSNKSWK